jgi:hypothetical protein
VSVAIFPAIQTNVPFDDRFPIAAALLPCTSTLDDAVRGMRTSQIPTSKRWDLISSVQPPYQLNGPAASPIAEHTTESKDRSAGRHFALYS